MKKRLFAAFLVATMVVGLGACGAADQDKDPNKGQDTNLEQDADEGGEATTEGAIDNSTDATLGEGDSEKGNGQNNSNATTGTGGTTNKPSTGGTVNKPSTGTDQTTTGGAANGGNTNSGDSSTSKPSISGSFEDIISDIYKKVGYEVNTSKTEVTSENAEYYLGKKDIKFKKALASEPMMSSIAHSLVLVEVEDGADIGAIKKSIKENVNGYKWICVGVEPENILVDNVGNYIMLIMDGDAQGFMDAFLAMGK